MGELKPLSEDLVEADIDGKDADTVNALIYGRESAGTTHSVRVNSNGELIVSTSAAIASVVGDGRQVVAVPGTAIALAGATTIKEVTVTAEEDNTGVVVVGSSTVIAALATRRGTPLHPMSSTTIAVDNLDAVFIDAIVATDGVTYQYLA